MTVELYSPSEVQEEAHACTAREILYGGTAGCGKSVFLRRDPYVTQWHHEHERYKATRRAGQSFTSRGWALHLRREFPMLKQTIRDMIDFARKIDDGAEWNARDFIINHKCGYKIQFGHMQHEDDFRAYDSQEYTHLALDEANQFTSDQFDYLRSRVRTTDSFLRPRLRVVMASNPDCPDEGLWLKKRFVDPAPMGRVLLSARVKLLDGTEETRTRMFIPAYLADNPDRAFAHDYEADLHTLPEHIREARLHNNWNVVAGAFFAHTFIPRIHVVEPFKLPDHWPKFRTYDHGFKKAAVCKYYAINEDGDLICYRELTWNHDVPDYKRKDAQLIAIAIREVEKANGEWNKNTNSSKLTGPADYQICEDRGSGGVSIEDRMAQEGIYWEKCKKNRYAGTQELVRRLKDIPKATGARPGITWFNTCVHTIRTMQSITTDKTDAELPKDGGDDHWLDCDFYAVLYRKAAAEKGSGGSDDDDEEDELHQRRKEYARRCKYGYGM